MTLSPETLYRLKHLGDHTRKYNLLMENPQPESREWLEEFWDTLRAMDEDIKLLHQQ